MPLPGEIRMFAGNFEPQGWLFCDGRTFASTEYPELYKTIGTTYGGDGTSYALPDLRGRLPVSTSDTIRLGQRLGVPQVALTPEQLPAHTHSVNAVAALASTEDPTNSVVSDPQGFQLYVPASPETTMAPSAVVAQGGGQPHNNMQPYLSINFLIAVSPQYDDPFYGEIRIWTTGFAPRGWMPCDGQILAIMRNTALFSILGDAYGGDGRNSFALPDLRGRVPLQQMADAFALGNSGGEEQVSLRPEEMPAHTHQLQASMRAGKTSGPASDATLGVSSSYAYTADTSQLVTTSPMSIGLAGDSQPHNNLQPYLALQYCIATEQMMFPTRW